MKENILKMIKMKEMKRGIVLGIFLSIFLISLISATTTTLLTSPTSFTVNPGNSGTITISYSINNPFNNTGANGVSLTGSPRFISYSGGSLNYGALNITNGTLSINYNIPSNASGTVVNSVVVDGYVLDLTFNVQIQQNQTSSILVFPTSKIITVTQGDSKTQNIQVTVPPTYPRTITINSVDLNPTVNTISFGDLNLGQVAPGQSINIPIVFSGVGASTGTYQTQLTIFAIDSQGQVNLPSVNLQLQVSAGINPLSNFSLAELPTCSLSAIELNLNSTYQMTCSKPNPNIEITTDNDPFYLKGLGAEETPSQIVYNFKAVNIGNTIFKAQFLYKNLQVGNEFNQTIRITSSGSSPISGVTFNFTLYQGGNQKQISELHEGDIIIQLKDNSTGNIIDNYKLYLGGVQINNSLAIKSGINYQLTATSPGYNDNSLNFNISSIPSVITLTPSQQSYLLGQTINISTDSNATLYIDNVQITSPYLFTTVGNRLLKASKEGYVDTFMNLTINSLVSANVISPEVKDWSKGKDVTMKLSSSGVWNVTFEKLNDDKTYSSALGIATGVGDQVSFNLADYGRYNVYLDNTLVRSDLLEKNNWFIDNWYYVLGVIVIIVLVYLIFFKGKSGGEESVEAGY